MSAGAGSALFESTVPRKDYLNIRDKEGNPDPKQVVDLLRFRTRDVAAAAGVSKDSVRFDKKMPVKVRRRIEEWEVALQLVAKHFDGDAQRTAMWFSTPNYLLGNVSPRDMIRHGRFKRLLKVIQAAMDENVEHN